MFDLSSFKCNDTFHVSSRDVARLFYAQVPDMRRGVLARQKRWYGLETWCGLWSLRCGLAQDGEIDWNGQTAEEAALEHTAQEAGAIGEIASFLGPIEDHWKSTLTRW